MSRSVFQMNTGPFTLLLLLLRLIMFIFFSIGNPKRTNKFGNKPVQANRDEVNKKKKDIEFAQE